MSAGGRDSPDGTLPKADFADGSPGLHDPNVLLLSIFEPLDFSGPLPLHGVNLSPFCPLQHRV